MIKPVSSIDFIRSFLKELGLPAKKINISQLAGDGSKRLFQRFNIEGINLSYIIMSNYPYDDYLMRENAAYLEIGKHLFNNGLPLPEIFSFDLNNGLFILQDMGDRNLQQEVHKSHKRLALYEELLEILIRLQVEGRKDFNIEWCCQTAYYDTNLMRQNEAFYFRDSFLKGYMGIKEDLNFLEEAFDNIITIAEKAEREFLLHRDFQSRNIMYTSGNLSILDWQGARLGPLAYDLASLLLDPYVNLTYDEKSRLYEVYIKMLKELRIKSVDSVERYYPYIAIMRNLQVLGAYAYLSRNQGKSYFEKYIPVALSSLKKMLEDISDSKLSPLTNIINSLVLT